LEASLSIRTIIAFVLSLLIQVGYPLAVTLIYRRRTGTRWQLFIYGALIFAVFQLFSWLPMSVYLDALMSARFTSGWGAFLWLMALALATSLVEEMGRWCGYRYLFPRGAFKLTWHNGIMYGLGHSSVETTLLIAGLTFIHFLAYLALNRLGLEPLARSIEASPALITQLKTIANTSWDQPLIVALERILALPHQLAWSLLVMESLVYRQKRWLGFAVLYHASIAVIVPGLARLAGFFLAEGINFFLALLSLGIVFKLRLVSPEE